MKKHTIAWRLVAIGLLAIGLMSQGAYADRAADGTAFLQSVKSGQYAEAVSHFDAVMKQAMSAAQLKDTWEMVCQKVGAYGGITKPQVWKKDVGGNVYDIVQFPSKFGSTSLDIWVVYDLTGEIGGLWFLNPSPGGPPAAITQGLPAKSAGPQYTAPSYVRKERFEEYPIFVNEGEEWQLPGTLTMPKGEGPFPILILVHGSGPNDRDEAIGPNKPFMDIAWGLASNGIAVVRYDKRTKVHSAKLAKMVDKITVKEETVDDALAAVSLTHSLQRIDLKRIYVLGHSLGGMLIPRIGAGNSEIAGLIVLAGPTRPFEDILLEQVTYIASLKDTLTADDKAELAKLKQQVANVKSPKLSLKTPMSTLPLGTSPASYWLDLRGYKPAESAKTLKQPMLIMQGGRDYQVTEADFKLWKDALSSRTDVTFKLYPDLNHLFMTGVGKATPSEYEKPGSVEPAVVSDIADWINGQQTVGAK